jgi:hypothetical protein
VDLEQLPETPQTRFGFDDEKQRRVVVDEDREDDRDNVYADGCDFDAEDAARATRCLPCVACRLERAALDPSTSPYGLPHNARIREGRGDDGRLYLSLAGCNCHKPS